LECMDGETVGQYFERELRWRVATVS
jgi:hypothetical protein